MLQKRMPSGMQGYKRDVEEGGVRNYLAVKGPGVQAGVIDSTLTDIADILPTLAALAGELKLPLPAATEACSPLCVCRTAQQQREHAPCMD